ncbi:hypothetical protein AMBR_DPAELIID_02819 [Lacticaseibacillus rhamnosus]|nr:hypothetical protein AMBR_DPAELIID_02819 [Lacticaseibacillus rhamnosus]
MYSIGELSSVGLLLRMRRERGVKLGGWSAASDVYKRKVAVG